MILYREALQRFRTIYKRIQSSKLNEPTAMALATADKSGQPTLRIVLLKDFDDEGFVFYTNQKSRKGKNLTENPKAALCFFWDAFDDQIRIEGDVEPVSDAEANAYWVTRPRQSQIGAWASLQSEECASRSQFLRRVAKFVWEFKNRPIPRPPHWSGYRLRPNRIEFWKRKAFRLHERILYLKSSGRWRKTILYP